ncbi:MAG: flagellar export chaperone FlgN [Anaerolineales bacterium]|nr:flagellar export chaperone FlgN [Anaerolineales bacterium]
MNIRREHLRAFESLLVKEFRACQTLFDLTREERQALSRSDVPRLLELAESKEILLDQLEKLEDARRILLHNLGNASSYASPKGETAALAAVLGAIDKDEAERLMHLQEGILVLMSQMRELNHGNRALAACALERASILQTNLAKLWQVPANWDKRLLQSPRQSAPVQVGAYEHLPHRSSEIARINLPAVFASIVSAQRALKTEDQAALSTAIDELQGALEHLGKFLGEESIVHGGADSLNQVLQEAQATHQAAPESRQDANLIEVMADLYQQETAYQAVLKASNRMVAYV